MSKAGAHHGSDRNMSEGENAIKFEAAIMSRPLDILAVRDDCRSGSGGWACVVIGLYVETE